MLFEEFELAEMDGAQIEKMKAELSESEYELARKLNAEVY